MQTLFLTYEKEILHKGRLTPFYKICAVAVNQEKYLKEMLQKAETKTFELFDKGLYNEKYCVYLSQTRNLNKKAKRLY